MALIAHWPLNGTLVDLVKDNLLDLGKYYPEAIVNFDNDGPLGKCVTKSGVSASVSQVCRLSSTNESKILLDGKYMFSLSAWVKPINEINRPGDRMRTVVMYSGAYLSLTNDRKVATFAYGIADTTYKITEVAIDLNKWSHIAVTFERNLFKIFINGIKVMEQVPNKLDTVITMNNKFSATLFAESLSREFIGSMCDARIYDHTLSEDDVLKLYKETKSIDLNFDEIYEPTPIPWNDNTSKITKIISPGGSEDENNFCRIISPSEIDMKLSGSKYYYVAVRPQLKKFIMKFKLKNLSSTPLRNIGGHCRPYSNTNDYTFLSIKDSDFIVDGNIVPNKCFSDSYTFNPRLGFNEDVSVRLSVDMPYPPNYDVSGLCIQPNRGISYENNEERHLKIYDLDIRESDCLAIRDSTMYTRFVEDKSNVESRTYPEKYTERSTSFGHTGGLRFNKRNTTPKFFEMTGKTIPSDFSITIVARFNSIPNATSDEAWTNFVFRCGDNTPPNRTIFALNFSTSVAEPRYIYPRLQNKGNSYALSGVKIEVGKTYHIVISKRSNAFYLHINGVGMEVPSMDLEFDGRNPALGDHSPTGSAFMDFDISEFNVVYPHKTDEDILKDYNSRKNRVSSFAFAFDDSIDISSSVPKIWETNIDSEGTQCFSRNPLITNKSEIPLSWGGEMKSLEVAPLKNGISEDKFIESNELVMVHNGPTECHEFVCIEVDIDNNAETSSLVGRILTKI